MTRKRIPVPGQPVRGSRSGAPIMALFDLLGRRWAMGVLWTLCETDASTFRSLQERCEGISPGVLNQRIKELIEAKLVDKGADGYVATGIGRLIYKQLVPLGAAARRWGELVSEKRSQ